MVLDNGDKAQCREIAREIIERVMEMHVEQANKNLILHEETCSHGQFIKKAKMLLAGAFLGGGLSGGGIATIIYHIVTGG